MTNIPSKFPTLESEKHVASAVDWLDCQWEPSVMCLTHKSSEWRGKWKQIPILFQWGHNSAGYSSCESRIGEITSSMFWWQPKIISFQPNSAASLKHSFQTSIIAFHKTVEIQFTMNFQDHTCMHKEEYLPLQILATLSFHGLFTNPWSLSFLVLNYILPSFHNNKYRPFIRILVLHTPLWRLHTSYIFL